METLAFVGMFHGFSETPEQVVERIDKELERVNDLWAKALAKGQDDDDPMSDAYMLKRNARRLTHLLEQAEAKLK